MLLLVSWVFFSRCSAYNYGTVLGNLKSLRMLRIYWCLSWRKNVRRLFVLPSIFSAALSPGLRQAGSKNKQPESRRVGIDYHGSLTTLNTSVTQPLSKMGFPPNHLALPTVDGSVASAVIRGIIKLQDLASGWMIRSLLG